MMQRLYLELHSKYDAAIKHVEGRVGRTPPRPLAAVAAATVEAPAAHVAADAPDAVVRKREL
jgi:hypothetical protein